MHNPAIFIQILSSLRGDGNLPPTSIIPFEESESVAASDDTSALIMEKGRGITFEDRDVVAEGTEGDAGAETA